MKSFKHLLLAKGVAAAIVGMSGIAAPAISHASPDDGSICRAGYSAQFAGGNMKCTKHVIRHVSLECTTIGFPIKRVRVPGIAGDLSGRDICLRNNGIDVSSNAPLTGLIKGQDFVFVSVNQAKVSTVRQQVEHAEEGALGLPDAGVDARSAGTLNINGGVGAEDNVTVDVTLFTFPVPAPTLIRLPIQIDIPVIDFPLP